MKNLKTFEQFINEKYNTLNEVETMKEFDNAKKIFVVVSYKSGFDNGSKLYSWIGSDNRIFHKQIIPDQFKKMSSESKFRAWITSNEPLTGDSKKSYAGFVIAEEDLKKFKAAISMKEDPSLKRDLKAKVEFVLSNFVNESSEINERRATYLPGPDKDIADFLKPFAKKSVDSLGFGYKGGSKYYNIEIDATSGYDNKELPKDVFGLTPYADGDYWSKRHLKKVAPMFAKDLNSLQKKYKVEFLEYDSKANQVLIKVTKQ